MNASSNLDSAADVSVAIPQAAASDAETPPRSFRRRLYSSAFWSIGGRVASIGSIFIASAIMADALPNADFAAYTIAAAAATLLAMPASLGAPRVILRLTREAQTLGDQLFAGAGVRACMRLIVLSCAAVSALYLVGSELLDPIPKYRAARDYAPLVAVWFSGLALSFSLSHALQGVDRYRAAALTGARNGGIIANVLFMIFVAGAAAGGALTLRGALLAQAALNMAAAAVAWLELAAAMRRWPAGSARTVESGAAANLPTLGSLFHECWPVLVIQLTSLGIMQVDILLVGWLTSDREIALYGAIARLGEVLGAAQILAAGIAAPFVSELLVSGQTHKLEQMLRGVASLVAAPTLVAAAVFLVAPEWVLATAFNADFIDAAATLRIVTIGSVIAALTGTNSLALIMAGEQRQLLRASVAASVVYLIVAPLFIQAWSIEGAAAATAVVFGAYNVCVTLMVRRLLGVWTFASLSPQFYRFAIQQVIKKK